MSSKLNSAIQNLPKRPILVGTLLGAIVLSLLGAGKTSFTSFENKSESASNQDFTLPSEDRAVVVDPITYGVTLKAIDTQ